VHNAEVIEFGVLPTIAFRQIDGKVRRDRESPPCFLLVRWRKVGLLVFLRPWLIPVDRKAKLAASARGLRSVIERPIVARAVVAQRRRPKLAGNERRDKCAARLV